MPDSASLYAFAGIAIASTLALPELPPAAPSATPRCCVDESPRPLLPDGAPDARHDWLDPAGGLTLTGLRFGDTHYLLLPGLAQARLHAGGRVTVWRDRAASAVSLRHALVDQILPRLLAGNGALMVHAAAIVDAGTRALVLLGETGYGKSTLCAAFARSGARLLTDDCLRLEADGGSVRAIPTYPGIRLRPDSLSALYGNDLPATAPVADYMDKRRVALPVPGRAATGAAHVAPSTHAEVGTVVLLRPPGEDAGITLARLPPADACMELVRNSFTPDPADMARVRALLARAAEVVDGVPVHALGYPRDYTCLPEVIARLRELRW